MTSVCRDWREALADGKSTRSSSTEIFTLQRLQNQRQQFPLATSFIPGHYISFISHGLPNFKWSSSPPAFSKQGTPGDEGCLRWLLASSCITEGTAEILIETFKEEEVGQMLRTGDCPQAAASAAATSPSSS